MYNKKGGAQSQRITSSLNSYDIMMTRERTTMMTTRSTVEINPLIPSQEVLKLNDERLFCGLRVPHVNPLCIRTQLRCDSKEFEISGEGPVHQLFGQLKHLLTVIISISCTRHLVFVDLKSLWLIYEQWLVVDGEKYKLRSC